MTNSFSDVKDRDLQTPMSAGYLHKKTFFPPLAHKSRLMLRRSESERKLPAPVKYERGGGEAPLTGINTAVSHQNYPHTKPQLHGDYIAKLNQLYHILVSSSRHLQLGRVSLNPQRLVLKVCVCVCVWRGGVQKTQGFCHL